VVILGTPHSPADALAHFHNLWWYAAATAALSGLACTVISHKARVVAEPTPVAEAVPESRVAV